MDQELDLDTPKITVHGTAVYYGTDREDRYLGWVDRCETTGNWYGQSRYTDTNRKARLYGKTRKAVTDQILELHLNR